MLAASATAFFVIKMAGAAYLIYLGIRMAFGGTERGAALPEFRHESGWTIYRAGVLTNVLNPKVALFFMAFLPQFVTPGSETRVPAFLMLGAIFVFNGTLWCLALVMMASAMSRRLRESAGAGLWLRRASGATFLGLGVRLAASRG